MVGNKGFWLVSKFSYRAVGQINSLPNRIIVPQGYINAINMFRDVQQRQIHHHHHRPPITRSSRLLLLP